MKHPLAVTLVRKVNAHVVPAWASNKSCTRIAAALPAREVKARVAAALAACLIVFVLGAWLVAAAADRGAVDAARREADPAAQAQWIGVFTGERVNGAPVYRLPPVTVVASRGAELAKIEREARLARTGQPVPDGQHKPVARPPA